MNMSAGYNGLESGQIVVVSSVLLTISVLRGDPDFAPLLFASLLGCSLGLYYFNRYPAHVFIGDIGTLGLGAALAAGVVLGHLYVFGLVWLYPPFFCGGAAPFFGVGN